MKNDNIPAWIDELATSWENISEASFNHKLDFDHPENAYSVVHAMLAEELREDAAKNMLNL